MKNKVKVFRAMYDLTQDTLAKAVGVTRQTILAIEKGKYDPSLDLAFRIALFFNVKIEEVFEPGLQIKNVTVFLEESGKIEEPK